MRGLVLVVVLLWGWLGLASAQQVDTTGQGNAVSPTAAGASGGGGAEAAPPAAAGSSVGTDSQATPLPADSSSGGTGTAAAPPPSAAGSSGAAGTQAAPPAAAAPDNSYDSEAADLLKKLTARQFDARLPATPLADWFAGEIGKRAQIQWTTADCGDEGDESDPSQGGDAGGGSSTGSSDANGNATADVTLCSEAQALFYDASGKPSLDRYVVLQLWVGSRRLGINGDPGDYGPDALSVFVFDGTSTRTLSRLGDLPGALAALN